MPFSHRTHARDDAQHDESKDGIDEEEHPCQRGSVTHLEVLEGVDVEVEARKSMLLSRPPGGPTGDDESLVK